MDEGLLDTCSPEFREQVEKLEDKLDNSDGYIPELAPAFYVLDRLESDLVGEYCLHEHASHHPTLRD